MPVAATFTVTLDGAMLRRGFWLYVWEITTPNGDKVLYVGRTGDSSSERPVVVQPDGTEPRDVVD